MMNFQLLIILYTYCLFLYAIVYIKIINKLWNKLLILLIQVQNVFKLQEKDWKENNLFKLNYGHVRRTITYFQADSKYFPV